MHYSVKKIVYSKILELKKDPYINLLWKARLVQGVFDILAENLNGEEVFYKYIIVWKKLAITLSALILSRVK